jgi:hypothetical protein
MNYWKITNVSNRNSKLIVSISPNQSKGLLLNPGQFCLTRGLQTPVMDAQIRRKLIEIEKDFDNTNFNLEIGKVYPVTHLNQLIQDEQDKMKQAKTDAENYVSNQE